MGMLAVTTKLYDVSNDIPVWRLLDFGGIITAGSTVIGAGDFNQSAWRRWRMFSV